MLGCGPITSPTSDEGLSKREGRDRHTQKHWTFDVICSLRRCPVAAEGAGSSLVSLTTGHRNTVPRRQPRRGGLASWGTSPFNLHLSLGTS